MTVRQVLKIYRNSHGHVRIFDRVPLHDRIQIRLCMVLDRPRQLVANCAYDQAPFVVHAYVAGVDFESISIEEINIICDILDI